MSMKLNFLIIFFLSVYGIDTLAQADKTILNRAQDGSLKLQVNNGGVPTDALTIDGSGSVGVSGSVGIGTSSPSADQHILGSAPELRIEDTSGTTSAAPRVKFYENGTELGAVGDTASLRSALMFSTNTGKDMMFFTDNQNTSTDTPRMTIDSAGDTEFSGDVTINGADKGLTINTGDLKVQGANLRIDKAESGSLANGASLPDIEVASGGLLYSGTIHAFCMQEGAGFANQTYRMYHTSGRGNTALFTVVDEHIRSSGCTFTVTRPFDRYIRLTNTSGTGCACGISYFGMTI